MNRPSAGPGPPATRSPTTPEATRSRMPLRPLLLRMLRSRRAHGAFALLLVAALAASRADALSLQLQVLGPGGTPAEARLQVISVQGLSVPHAPDVELMAHSGYNGTYFYPTPGSALELDPGTYRVRAWHGPEWYGYEQSFTLDRDTTLVVQLSRMVDLRPRGWYSGDLHVHAEHPPVEYAVSDERAVSIARAEGLSVLHLLDQARSFTGQVSTLSDSLVTLYCTYEYRNQTGGHAVFAGLTSALGDECCLPPEEPWPMLYDLHGSLAAQGGLMVLAHPRTTTFDAPRDDWPGAGMGREMALLGALGGMEAMDAVSYSNEPDADWSDWYDLLSSGLDIPLSAGTDAVLDWYDHPPAGGWRVYVQVAAGTSSFYSRWLAGLRAGRTFATCGPLVPRFEISGVAPGGTLALSSDTLQRPLRIEARCEHGLAKLALIADGAEVWSAAVGGRESIDTTLTLRITTPRWLALRVDGASSPPGLNGLASVGHTNAIRVTLNGNRRPLATTCARLWDEVLDWENMLIGDSTLTAAHADSVRARGARARAVYGKPWVTRSGSFRMLTAGAVAPARFTWRRSTDTEANDRVRYLVEVDTASTFPAPMTWTCEDTTLVVSPAKHGPWWWRVTAIDRGGNKRVAQNAPKLSGDAPLDAPPPMATRAARAYPNPARSEVRLEGFSADARVFDTAGRVVASRGRGLEPAGNAFTWRLRGAGRAVPPGLYFVADPARARTTRIVVLP